MRRVSRFLVLTVLFGVLAGSTTFVQAQQTETSTQNGEFTVQVTCRWTCEDDKATVHGDSPCCDLADDLRAAAAEDCKVQLDQVVASGRCLDVKDEVEADLPVLTRDPKDEIVPDPDPIEPRPFITIALVAVLSVLFFVLGIAWQRKRGNG